MEEHLRDIELEKRMDAYIKGRLDNREAEELWVELLQRPDYIEYLQTELAVKAILDQPSSGNPSKGADTGNENIDVGAENAPGTLYKGLVERPWKWVAAAACIAVLLISISYVMMPDGLTPQQLALREISLVDKLSHAPVMRDETRSLSEPDSLLNAGFRLAVSGEAGQAVGVFEELATRFEGTPVVAKAHLNIGIIRYNGGQHQEAAEAFRQALSSEIENPVLREKALWFLGNAYLHTGNRPGARSALEKAVALDGIYRAEAEALLESLEDEPGDRP